jgi:hypothetical protein
MLIDVEAVRERQAQIRREVQAINASRGAGMPRRLSSRFTLAMTAAVQLCVAVIARYRCLTGR